MSTTYEPFSRGALLNHYVIGMDDKINVADSMSEDKSLWYFQAPSTFLGNHGITYGGYVSFTLASLSGDFEKINSNAAVIQLDCNDCIGPVGKGITLHYPMSALSSTFDGSVQKFDILLHENSGWLKDPQNTLLAWNPPTQCDIIQVLSRLSSFRILGDWTRWYETIALDDVSFHNTKSQLPICSMIFPDASICTCDDEDEVASANSTSF